MQISYQPLNRKHSYLAGFHWLLQIHGYILELKIKDIFRLFFFLGGGGRIWVEVRAPLIPFKPSSKISLLIVPRRCFFCGLFMLFLSYCHAFMHVCLLMPSGHLLGKGWPHGSRLWCLIVTLSLSHWYSVSGVVLDCMESWSLPAFLLGDTKSIGQGYTCLSGHFF